MIKLDALDRKLLIELDKNARQPFSQLAKRTNSSKAVVSYRMKNLEHEGVIKNYLTVVNTVKLGYLTFKVYIKLQSLDEESEKRIFNAIASQKNILRVVKLGGYDLSVLVLAKNTFEFNEILRKIKEIIGHKLNSYEVELILFSQMSGLKFLGDKTKYSRMDFQGSEGGENIKIDKLDNQILKEIAVNSRKPLVEIALKLKTGADVIKYRLRRLEKQGIITRYRHLLDLSKLGYYHFIILLKVQNASVEDEEKIMEYTMDEPAYMYTTKIIGAWDFEINLLAASLEEFNEALSKLKNKFSKIIQSYSTVFVSKEIKLDYYPF